MNGDKNQQNEKDQAMLKLQSLESRLAAIESQKDSVVASESAFNENRKLHYQEAGEWARHYSSVRMTVATFAITACMAIIALKWDKDAPVAYVGNSTAILWLLGFLIFHAFTYQTYKMFNRQLKYRGKLLADSKEKDAPRKRSLIMEDAASIVIWLITLLFGLFAFSYGRASVCCPLKIALVLAPVGGVIYAICMDDYLKRKEQAH